MPYGRDRIQSINQRASIFLGLWKCRNKHVNNPKKIVHGKLLGRAGVFSRDNNVTIEQATGINTAILHWFMFSTDGQSHLLIHIHENEENLGLWFGTILPYIQVFWVQILIGHLKSSKLCCYTLLILRFYKYWRDTQYLWRCWHFKPVEQAVSLPRYIKVKQPTHTFLGKLWNWGSYALQQRNRNKLKHIILRSIRNNNSFFSSKKTCNWVNLYFVIFSQLHFYPILW